MQLNKPKFWDKKSFLTYLLFPISVLVMLFVYFKKKTTKSLKFNIPIICVGNIYVGGTGKTPTSIYLAKALSKIGRNPVILRKYYRNHIDEHEILQKNFDNVIINTERAKGILEAINKKHDSVILDDGFQDYKIKKDLNIICFNQNQLLGNGFVLPAGPLRDNLNSLKKANLILINGKKDKKFEEKLSCINNSLKVFYSKYVPTNLDQFKNKKLLAIAGIGNPENFFKLLSENNLDLRESIVFPDHYKFKEEEISKIIKSAHQNNMHIIMTEKDYYKIKKFNIKNIEYLKINLEITDKEKFLQTIKDIYDKKN